MNVFSAFLDKPHNVRFATQEPGEQIIFVLRRAFITNVPWIVMSAVSLVLPLIYMNYVIVSGSPITPLFTKDLENTFIIIWYIFTVMYTIERFITWYFNVYIVTDRRIVDVDFAPLFYKRISEATYHNVEDTSFSMNSFFQTVFNYGNVFIQTAAEKTEFEFHDVPYPNKVQDKISDLAAALANRRD